MASCPANLRTSSRRTPSLGAAGHGLPDSNCGTTLSCRVRYMSRCCVPKRSVVDGHGSHVGHEMANPRRGLPHAYALSCERLLSSRSHKFIKMNVPSTHPAPRARSTVWRRGVVDDVATDHVLEPDALQTVIEQFGFAKQPRLISREDWRLTHMCSCIPQS